MTLKYNLHNNLEHGVQIRWHTVDSTSACTHRVILSFPSCVLHFLFICLHRFQGSFIDFFLSLFCRSWFDWFSLVHFGFVAFHVPLSPSEGTCLFIYPFFPYSLIVALHSLLFWAPTLHSNSPSYVAVLLCCFSLVLKQNVPAVRPGSVKNIIQQFENQTDTPGEEGGDAADPQRLSSSSLGEEGMDRWPICFQHGSVVPFSSAGTWRGCFLSSSPAVSVRLARSESLKAQGEGRRRGTGSGGDSVPRSRSDVDIEDCGDEQDQQGLRPLQQSTSSSASSISAR